MEDLKGLLHREKFGIMGLAETWLTPGQNVEIERYQWIGVEREGVAGRGGVGIFVNNDYFMSEEKTGMSQVKGIETVWVHVSLKGMPKTLVGVVYISPHIHYTTAFHEKMIEFLACKQQDGLEVVLMGDFNAHFTEGGASLDCRASLLDRVSTELSLATMNWSPVATGKFTWESRSTRSMLDYVLVPETWVKVIDQFLVDEEGCLM